MKRFIIFTIICSIFELVCAQVRFICPEYDKISFETGEMISPEKDTSVTYAGVATFTLKVGQPYCAANVFGAFCNKKEASLINYSENTGCFAFYNGKYRFFYAAKKDLLKLFHDNSIDCMFQSYMIIFNYRKKPLCQHNESPNYYRALCELNGKLYIADCIKPMKYTDFVKVLLEKDVKYAMYLDSGYGWIKSWYRPKNAKVEWIHDCGDFPYTTNYIVFRRH